MGRLVLLHDGSAVLAVDENLRYGPAKSGYHGGASPAEAVVPVTVLVPGGAVPDDTGLRLAPPQEPDWWIDPVLPTDSVAPASVPAARPVASSPVPSRPSRTAKKDDASGDMTLFDVAEPVSEPEPAPSSSAAPPSPEATAAAVLASAAYKANKKRAGRVAIEDGKVAALLTALAESSSHRLPQTAAASALAVPTMMLRGAVSQVQQLLNIDGTAVIRVDADGSTVILDIAALQEQYGIIL
jgi:hypothetical protein